VCVCLCVWGFGGGCEREIERVYQLAPKDNGTVEKQLKLMCVCVCVFVCVGGCVGVGVWGRG